MNNPYNEQHSLEKRMQRLEAIYALVDVEQNAFKSTSINSGREVGCPPRCGVCCVHFTPDVLPIEADRVASFLIAERPDLGQRFSSALRGEPRTDPACPFWDSSKPGENCSIYPARPLICRLFAFCSTRSKQGEPEFALCSDMPDIEGIHERRWRGAETLMQLFGAVPPPMHSFSARVAALDPSSSGERRLITEALPGAIARVGLLLSLAKSDEALYR